jgi:phage FluMu protein Com
VAPTELRCDCGNLLARRVDGGVELKCRRCKRTVVLPLADG